MCLSGTHTHISLPHIVIVRELRKGELKELKVQMPHRSSADAGGKRGCEGGGYDAVSV